MEQQGDKPSKAFDPSAQRIIALAVAIVFFLLAITWTVKTLFVSATYGSYDFAKKVATDIDEKLQFTPQVTMASQIVVAQNTSRISELATVEKELLHKYDWENSWLGSKKVIEMEAIFTVKAGFDLTETFSINIKPKTLEVTVHMPKAKILSVEKVNIKTIRADDGWWNGLKKEDRDKVENEMTKQVREQAEVAGLLQEAELNIEDDIRRIILRSRNDTSVRFER